MTLLFTELALLDLVDEAVEEIALLTFELLIFELTALLVFELLALLGAELVVVWQTEPVMVGISATPPFLSP